jgi:anti-sigma regulatory factor (Ser/Thr protein kinase)
MAKLATMQCSFPSVKESVTEARRRAASFAEDVGADQDTTFDVALVVSEVATHAVRHAGRPKASGAIRVEAEADADVLTVSIAGTDMPAGPETVDNGLGMRFMLAACRSLLVRSDPAGSAIEATFALNAA